MTLRIAMLAHTDAPWTPLYGTAFQARGHVVKVASFHEDTLPGLDCEFLGTHSFEPGRSQWEYVTAARRAARLFRDFRPDVVFAPYVFSNGFTASLGWRGPLVVSACGSDVLPHEFRSPVNAWLQRQVVRFVCARATRVHAVAGVLVDALVSYGVAREKIECFPVGVEVERFAAAAGHESSGRDRHVIGIRKHDSVYQNHVIVEAIGRLRGRGCDVRCTLLGGGPLLEERRAQVRALGLEDRVSVLGHVRHEELPGYLASAAIYVSAASSDGASASLLEAMAAGAFPVVSRIRANEDWIEAGRNGLLFEVGDPVSLANALEKALGDEVSRREAAVANLARVARDADHSETMDRLDRLLRSAVSRSA